MPEYLSPGVFVEEIDVGVRPIEGVSTSTAGMVGTSERGPVNVPMLVTSYGEFERLFGGYLDVGVYGDHAWLPHGVEGFFQNGGKRLYVTRVVADQAANTAAHAGLTLFDRGEGATADTRLLKHARAGDAVVIVEATATLADGDSMRFGDGPTVEYGDLAAVGAVVPAATRLLALRVPLYQGFNPLVPPTVTQVTLDPTFNPYAGQLADDHPRGSTILALDPAFPLNVSVVAGAVLEIGAGADREYIAIAEVMSDPAAPRVGLAFPLGRDHAATAAVARVDDTLPTVTTNLSAATAAGDGLLIVAAAGAFAAGDQVRVTDGFATEYHLLATVLPFALAQGTSAAHLQGEPVQDVTFPVAAVPHATTLAAAGPQNERTLLVASVGPLAVGDHVRVGPAGPAAEFHEITAVAGATITLRHGLSSGRVVGDVVERVDRTAGAIATHLVQDLERGETAIFPADPGLAINVLVEIGAPGSATVEYRALGASGLGALVLAAPLADDHARVALVGRRDPMLDVEALDAGPWGNELSIIAEDDGLASTTVTANTLAALPIPLASAAGVEVGTVLDFGGRLAKVTARTGSLVSIQPQGAPFAVTAGDPVRTREFRLRIEWRKDGRVYRDEPLRYLSLDHRHSRYVETIAGAIGGPLRASDRRPEGQSDFIRVTDHATPAQSETLIRLGPDLLTEIGLGGRPRAAGRVLAGGTNPPAGIVAATYIGTDDPDPASRTGLAALRNERRISIVAIPGRTDADTQGALITHCENERYRFAVLDSIPGVNPVQGAPLPDVITHRNQYDTRYAALYYPWVVIRNPFGNQPGVPVEIAAPPAGHMMGIYARTDNERGVHKAPANAVIRGIRSLQRRLNQSEQDILNPSPTNVNVLRDFRDNGRGLRVWGGRCITSETDWKYINVRRLFIFLEQSLYEGTQWVVFEPNDARLWDRVRQSIGNFLTRVWRDGALQGASTDEAFFVKCDRTTMTQDDIDNGRLIVMVGVAPVKPAEFVIIRIFQATIEAVSA